MTIARVIVVCAVVGFISTAGIWGEVVDNLECKSTPTMERKAVRL